MKGDNPENLICPRCDNSKDFTVHDCGPDSYEDDVFYLSYTCDRCGLWYDGWRYDWYEDVVNWREVEFASKYKKEV